MATTFCIAPAQTIQLWRARSSSRRRRLSTPAVNAVWLPPPWQAMATRLRSTQGSLAQRSEAPDQRDEPHRHREEQGEHDEAEPPVVAEPVAAGPQHHHVCGRRDRREERGGGGDDDAH